MFLIDIMPTAGLSLSEIEERELRLDPASWQSIPIGEDGSACTEGLDLTPDEIGYAHDYAQSLRVIPGVRFCLYRLRNRETLYETEKRLEQMFQRMQAEGEFPAS